MSKRVSDIRPQARNANAHTQRGMAALESSIQADGWIGAITVAADGETFDGSARIETAATTGFNDAIVVESDGSKPVVVVRTDIPTADDPRAVRLGVAANRAAELNLAWSPEVLAQLAETVDLSGLFRDDELAAVLERAGDTIIGAAEVAPALEQWMIVITCADEQEQVALLERFAQEGLRCRALMS